MCFIEYLQLRQKETKYRQLEAYIKNGTLAYKEIKKGTLGKSSKTSAENTEFENQEDRKIFEN